MTEKVNHPPHYGGSDNLYEAIKVIENWNLGFHLGNVLKYICRLGKKDEEDLIHELRKARWYLDRKINLLEKEKEKSYKNIINHHKTHETVVVDGYGNYKCIDCGAYSDLALALECRSEV